MDKDKSPMDEIFSDDDTNLKARPLSAMPSLNTDYDCNGDQPSETPIEKHSRPVTQKEFIERQGFNIKNNTEIRRELSQMNIAFTALRSLSILAVGLAGYAVMLGRKNAKAIKALSPSDDTPAEKKEVTPDAAS